MKKVSTFFQRRTSASEYINCLGILISHHQDIGLLTVYHNVTDSPHLILKQTGGRNLRTLMKFDPLSDLCFIVIPKKRVTQDYIDNAFNLSHFKPATIGEKYCAISATSESFACGVIVGFNKNRWTTTMKTFRGFSGSPVCNFEGFIGLLQGSLFRSYDQTRYEKFAQIISKEVIVDFLNETRQPRKRRIFFCC